MDNYETGIYTDNPDDTLRYMKSAEVVEVVRCKDCKHAEIRKLFGSDIPFCKTENNVEQAKRPSHYCGYGEKRDEGQS